MVGVIALQFSISAASVGLALAVTIDFEGLANGLEGPFVLSGVTLAGSGANLGPAILDSDRLGLNAGSRIWISSSIPATS